MRYSFKDYLYLPNNDEEKLNEDAVFDSSESSVINENTVYEDNKLSIHVDPTANTNFKRDPYIKVYNGPYSTATKVVRIGLKDCRLIYNHKDRKPLGELEFTTELGKRLNEIMDQPISNKTAYKYRMEKIVTVYELIYHIIISVCGKDTVYFEKPDFTKCK